MLTDPRAKLIATYTVTWILGMPVLLWFCKSDILFAVLAAVSLLILSIISLVNPGIFSDMWIISGIPDRLYLAGIRIFALWSIPVVILIFLNLDLDYMGKLALIGGPPLVAILIYDVVWIVKSGKRPEFEVSSGMTFRLIATIVFLGIIITALLLDTNFPLIDRGFEAGLIIGYTIGNLIAMIISYGKMTPKSRPS
jgi:hypothetical protein